MATSWEGIFNSFYFKVQRNTKFFNYYNVSEAEAMDIATQLATGFLIESIARLTSICTPDVDFNDYDEISHQFNFDLTANEIDILSRLMLEMFFEKDMAKLSVATNVLSSQDVKYVFSGWQERNSFMAMFSQFKKDNVSLIKQYIAKDRRTGARKFPSYDL